MKAPDPARRSERARIGVLESTLALCAEEGFARVTVEGIAERAGVSKKTIYRWWTSKGEILLEAAIGLAEARASFPDSGDLRRDMCEQLETVIDMLSPQETSPIASLLAEAQRDPDLGAAVRDQLIQPFIDLFDERMRAAIATGELPDDTDLDIAVDLFYGPIYHRLVFRLGLPDEAHVRAVVDHVIAALRSDHRSAT